MNNRESYVPISCIFYDYLEEAATLGKVSTIVYEHNGSAKTMDAKIKTLLIKDKVEYMVLDNSTSIRLDSLISFNGRQLSINC